MDKLLQMQRGGALSAIKSRFLQGCKMKLALGNVFRQILNSKNRIFSSVVQNILPNFNLGFLHSAKTLDGCTTLNQCPVYARSALTLAEVLIVIGIIGIVSSLVLPSLIASNNERIAVTKLKKTYSMLYEAHRRAEGIYGPVYTWFAADTTNDQYTDRYAEKLFESMNVIKTCGREVDSGCFANYSQKYLNRNDITAGNIDANNIEYKVILSNGVSVALYFITYPQGNNLAAVGVIPNNPYEINYGFLAVDIDGPNKGPNIYGIDLFRFAITRTGIYPLGSRNDVYGYTDALFRNYCIKHWFCAAWILETGNMEYLNTDTTGKCPNGTMLGWNKTTCK